MYTSSICICHTLVIALMLTGIADEALAGKVGPEFRVNTTTAYQQDLASVAGLANGGFVVTWTDYLNYDSFPLVAEVRGQRYAPDGTPLGTQFRVNTTTANDQYAPSVAGFGNGGFVVTWTSQLQDGSSSGVYGQRYAGDGTPRGNEFRVNTSTAGTQANPSVARLAKGGFVVTWEGYGQDGDGPWAYGQRYNSDGTPRGKEFRVNTTMADPQAILSVAGLAKGGFVVTWVNIHDGGYQDVYGQRLGSDGTPRGIEFRVNTYTAGSQMHPSVAGLAKGGFVVVWDSYEQDGFGMGVYGQRYAGDGTPRGKEFRVNTSTFGPQDTPCVAGLANGGFVVTWRGYGQDGDVDGVYGQRYASDGTPLGKQFQVNTHTAGIQHYPSVAGLASGRFVVTWGSQGQDGFGYGVYGQRFSAP